jgi:hypothetical protein
MDVHLLCIKAKQGFNLLLFHTSNALKILSLKSSVVNRLLFLFAAAEKALPLHGWQGSALEGLD